MTEENSQEPETGIYRSAAQRKKLFCVAGLLVLCERIFRQ